MLRLVSLPLVMRDVSGMAANEMLLSILWYDSLSQNLLKYICLPANEAAFVKRQEYL
ncbi:uncharacterized protein PHALS_05239 [Plasmopara halstedii]|uniref:Uncharacterized protein n=1 Tax=Plasmopara halstedii TaxID=4781 RepID=A0A0N7L7S8_PLAHL|nr:uncharacterized protein PHALS_05239 [Plasmopara halstedii]CEG47915.1 hypothetical protein PHALS_05239 [Plasmopara halstedii]|eukprot:XP_024584284.1 hypothetical protein PHALS_05239 [Plasmopara halstedii]